MFKLGLIGFPIQHSLSPWIHTQFFERTNLTGTYQIFEIEPEESFAGKLAELKGKVQGFNVTVPYKEKIIDYLDEVDEQAKYIGAVNTVLLKDDKWVGYNTDGTGYVRALLSQFPELNNKKDSAILLLGAGGAAKGIYHALVNFGYNNITIANRTTVKAEQLIKSKNIGNVLTITEAEKIVSNFDVIIQTTSVGMKPDVDKSIIELTSINQGAIVSDIVYQPIMTKFLQDGKALGARVHFGHTMLIYQAQYAFEIWTGILPDAADLPKQLQTILEG